MKEEQSFTSADIRAIIETIIRESRRFPLTFEEIMKEVARRAFSQTRSQIESHLDALLHQGDIMTFSDTNDIRYYHSGNLEAIENRIITKVTQFHQLNPDLPGLSRKEIRKTLFENTSGNMQRSIDIQVFMAALNNAMTHGSLGISDHFYHLDGFIKSTGVGHHQDKMRSQCEIIREIFLKARYLKTNPDEIAKRHGLKKNDVMSCIRTMIMSEQIVQIEPMRYATSEFLNEVKTRLSDAFQRNQGLYITDIASILGISRKSVSPILDYLDKNGFTRREGDYRNLVRNLSSA